jgi:hypothetical protein
MKNKPPHQYIHFHAIRVYKLVSSLSTTRPELKARLSASTYILPSRYWLLLSSPNSMNNIRAHNTHSKANERRIVGPTLYRC